ncbi:uncharacterized protein PADG_11671 [Paracoccidioides brasiliensis Pb18]|uniref:Uncharacterized protein n=1 Tax=Paracoccidioides brasiliensis (strain Pb18) TaxID=502780 RepID=A0A0A0HXL5_PARBD|nr:uncharacterized protein PADG_11671 [Paracoccidioides brasiliensis Pb18]KGM92135.1 hypothetical protein PADG_11671 [Paracoccidioides brasiliensis Pb18]ODH50654.1 hypothetical protein GX48_03162 [Paracoccidioides brasiliensis]
MDNAKESTRPPALIPLLEERQQEVDRSRQRVREKQTVIDIERQLSGLAAVNDEARATGSVKGIMTCRQHWSNLLEGLLTWPASDPLEDERRRRNVGVEAVRQCCDFPEGGLP